MMSTAQLLPVSPPEVAWGHEGEEKVSPVFGVQTVVPRPEGEAVDADALPEEVLPVEVPKSGRMDRCSASWFLTYSKCSISKEVMMEYLKQPRFTKNGAKKHTPVYVTVGHELHKDGTDHLHALVIYDSKFRSVSVRCFDLQGHHPNMRTKNTPEILPSIRTYCQKGQDFVTYDPNGHRFEDTPAKKQNAKLDTMVQRVLAGEPILTVLRDYPFHGMNYLTKLKAVKAFAGSVSDASKRVWPSDYKDLKFFDFSNPVAVLIAKWLVSALFKTRTPRSQHLWLHGAPGIGKNSLIEYLEKYCRIYRFPKEGTTDFTDGYDDDNYDLVVIDEMHGQVPYPRLKEWLGGYTMAVAMKGAQAVKRKNIPFIILSNKSREKCYPNAAKDTEGWKAMTDRTLYVYTDAPIYDKTRDLLDPDLPAGSTVESERFEDLVYQKPAVLSQPDPDPIVEPPKKKQRTRIVVPDEEPEEEPPQYDPNMIMKAYRNYNVDD